MTTRPPDCYDPEIILGEFITRHGYDRVVKDGSHAFYALVQECDPQTLATRQAWRNLALSEIDAGVCMKDGYDHLMRKVADAVSEHGTNTDYYPAVIATVLVSYGRAKEIRDDSESEHDMTRERIMEMARESGVNETWNALSFLPTVSARTIACVSLNGKAIQVTTLNEDGTTDHQETMAHRLSDGDDDDRVPIYGDMDLSLVKGFMLLGLMRRVGAETGGSDPVSVCEIAVRDEFPFREEVMRSMLHAVVESVTISDEFAKTLLFMLRRMMSDEDGDE